VRSVQWAAAHEAAAALEAAEASDAAHTEAPVTAGSAS
jgi:hypothetical protein